ncbi:TRAP transporter substrate-binding protein [Spiribacter halobius]|uniref:ABC transporter substrate-binding protein n=1 Tax=Sediminicurvatus halobius TaxID=2182432 RepID=A0A2U2N7I5_9GAMM|nr:TRAP transporter substrate-binding protein [Spiribacter halobius]PWG64944.1 ABC transporter substrate-binding protein [Spiribacter halobius]UEX78200.1 TRAP transporter substrate-binding protein [Spiribacter halobius]
MKFACNSPRRVVRRVFPAAAGTLAALMTAAAWGADYSWTLQTGYAAGDEQHQSYVALAEKIEAMSGGRLEIDVSPGGTFVPAFEVIDAVNDGILDAGGGDGDYLVGRHPAGSLFASSPGFGMDSITLMSWMRYGGGDELFDEYVSEVIGFSDVQVFAMSPALAQPFGWFEEPIESVADIEGIKFRTPGLPVDVMEEMGAAVVTVPGSEVVPALERGVIESAEYFSPKADLTLGLSDIRKIYMMPSYLQIGLVLNVYVNEAKWQELPEDLKAIVEHAIMAESADFYWRYLRDNAEALAYMEEEQGVTVVRTPDDVMRAQLDAWEVVLNRHAEEDEFFAGVLESQRAYADQAVGLKARITPPLNIALEKYREE